jgi:hypothetical protein
MRKPYRRSKKYHKKKAGKKMITSGQWKLAKQIELKTGVHNFKEKVFDTYTITPSAAGEHFAATNFFFEDIDDYTSYQRIFKAYQILGVKTKYIIQNCHVSNGTTLNNTSATSTTLTTHSTPNICMVYDPTNAAAPTTMAKLLETKGARLKRLNNGVVTKFIKPKPLVKLYNGTLDTDYKIPNIYKNTWIATGEVDLQHYCLKEGWNNLSPNVVYTINRIRTYYLKFKIPQ